MAPAATQTRKPARKPAPQRGTGARTSAPARVAWRDLCEFVADAASSPKLKIDRAAGVIYGVKVLGRFSRNNHGLKEAINGTEYTPECIRAALPLYEGASVYCDHPDRQNLAGATRAVESTFGVLKNVRVESEGGDDVVRADLHYYTAHPMAERVCEDVERGIGRFGLSHNAGAARERFDRDAQRLVIEEIGAVRSVDLVNRPATNRNLWESQTVSTQAPKTITVRSLLESQRKRFSQKRLGWLRLILEDDFAAPMDAPMDAPPAEADPDEALWSGFAAAISAILDKYKGGELDSAGATKEIGKYIKAHDKLTGEDEPEEVEESEEDGEGGEMGKKKDESDADKTESVKLRAELDAIKRKDAVRDLCESEGVRLTPAQLKAACLLESDADRKQFVTDLKATAGAAAKPAGKPTRSTPPGGTVTPPAGGRQLAEGEAWDAEAALNTLRGAH